MCLAVPGQVLEVEVNALGMTMGKVSFGGIVKEVCLAYVPEVRLGEYVIVHVGFAISIVSEAEAAETFELLRQMGELAELEEVPAEKTEPGQEGRMAAKVPPPADPGTVRE
jgi:hydrogenase expression/formation protein HypC